MYENWAGCGCQGLRSSGFRSLRNSNPPEKSFLWIFGYAYVWIHSYLPFYSKSLWVPGFRISGNEEPACDPGFMVPCEWGIRSASAFLRTGTCSELQVLQLSVLKVLSIEIRKCPHPHYRGPQPPVHTNVPANPHTHTLMPFRWRQVWGNRIILSTLLVWAEVD